MCRTITLLLSLITAQAFGAYEARLWFENATTRADNPGTLLAKPGDTIEIWFHFKGLTQTAPRKWGQQQVTICLDGLTLMSDSDSSSWSDQIIASKSDGGPASDFLSTVTHDTDDGPMHDNAIDPTDTTKPLIANRGLYFLLGVNGNKTRSGDWTVRFFQFTVQPGSVGQKLCWCLPGRDTGTGLSTRLLLDNGTNPNITDQCLLVVPEPAAIGAFGFGMTYWLGRRRKSASIHLSINRDL